MSALRILSTKLDQKPFASWIIVTILIFLLCMMSTLDTLRVTEKAGLSFAQIYLLSMSLLLNLIFVFSIIVIFMTSDAYQNKNAWNRNLLIRAGNRKKWLAAHICYLAILSAYIVLISLVSYFISSLIFLNPKFLLSNNWTCLTTKNTFPDVFAWNWSPLKAVGVFSLLLFLRFLFLALVIFCINLTQKKHQWGFVFPLMFGLLEWKFENFFPKLALHSILPYDHTILCGTFSSITGSVQDRVPIADSLVYWGVLIGITVLWAYLATSSKDFAVLEGNQ